MAEKWTIEEDNIIIDLRSQGIPYKVIHKDHLFNRSLRSVQVRGSLLINRGKINTNKKFKQISWTDKECEELIKYKVLGFSTAEISSKLKKTESSIANKISILSSGISSKKAFIEEIRGIVNQYRTEEEYLLRFYHSRDIPELEALLDIFSDYEEARVILLNDSSVSYLYYVKIQSLDNRYFYKIGITSKDATSRFKYEKINYLKVIKTWEFSSLKEAREKEKEILRKYKDKRLTSDNVILSKGGNTELFNEDILGLDA